MFSFKHNTALPCPTYLPINPAAQSSSFGKAWERESIGKVTCLVSFESQLFFYLNFETKTKPFENLNKTKTKQNKKTEQNSNFSLNAFQNKSKSH